MLYRVQRTRVFASSEKPIFVVYHGPVTPQRVVLIPLPSLTFFLLRLLILRVIDVASILVRPYIANFPIGPRRHMIA